MKTSGFRRIAERYVRALFSVAEETGVVVQVETDLAALSRALAENKDFQGFLNNPLLPAEARAKAMLEILAKMQVHQLTRQFIGMLVREKRLNILPAAASLFVEWASAARGEMKVELVAAAPLKAKETKLVTDKLTKAYGRKINLTTRQDPALLGGVVLKIGSTQLDSSLSGKLERLGLRLKTAG